MTTTRTRDDILANLATARHEAGRVTVANPDHAAWHTAINQLLDELEATDSLPPQHTTATERTTASEQATP